METKKVRSSAKSIVSKKIKVISSLMTEESNLDEVLKKSAKLEQAFKKFQEAHEAFHSQLEDPATIGESENYYESLLNKVEQLQENVDFWIAGVEASRLLRSYEINPENSILNASLRTVPSRSSRSSSLSRTSHNSSPSARARATAKKAILKAEVATLKRLHEIEEEEIKLRQRKTQLKLEAEIAKAEAEELVYEHVESKTAARLLPENEQNKKSVPFLQPLATPHEDRFIKDEAATVEAKPDVHLPIEIGHENLEVSQPRRLLCPMEDSRLTSQHLPLNPEAPEWQNKAPQYLPFNAVGKSTPQTIHVSPVSGDIQLLLRQQQEAIMALTLPQPDVPVFTGDPVEYCDFIRAFENLIERRTSVPNARLYYLLQYTSGQVQDMVRSCLAMQEDRGYMEARKLLAERYGQSYKIAIAYVDRVINGQPIRAEDGSALQKFSTLLTSCRNTLKEIGYLNRLENPEGLRKIVDRLPNPLRLKWRKLVDTITQKEARDPNLKDITDIVEARLRVTNQPIFGKVEGEPSRSSNLKYNDRTKRDARSFSVEGKPKLPYSPSSTPEKKVLKCPTCNNNHWLSQCSDFKELPLSNRLKFAHAKKLCLNCLVSGHFVQDCPKQSFCRVEGCTKKHSTFLHEKERTQEVTPSQPNQSNGATKTEVNATATQVK